jgi:hypothetical protein
VVERKLAGWGDEHTRDRARTITQASKEIDLDVIGRTLPFLEARLLIRLRQRS